MAAPEKLRPLNIAFVCVGNSSRSQMAEAFANKLGAGRVRAWSAGSALPQIVHDRQILRGSAPQHRECVQAVRH